MRVCELIDTYTKDWNYSLVHELFWREETDIILAIPISMIDGDDFVVWHHTACGKFFVRSAYHVAVSLASQSQSSTSQPHSPLWKALWQANVPRKIRVFTWKLAQNALPLGLRRIFPNGNLKVLSPFVGLFSGIETVASWNERHCDTNQTRSSNIPCFVVSAWGRATKLNYDGAMFSSSLEIGIGVIARDSTGVCVWLKSIRKRWILENEMVEALAARDAVLLARRFSWRRVVLEGDCANIHSKLISHQPDSSTTGAVIRDIKCLVFKFDLCSFCLFAELRI
ncbi:UNVERIFIED_CONTAM: hypothetical protein Sangu_2858300, partial [Sesamum angustifolium]